MEKILLGSIADIQTGPFGSQLHKEDYVQDGTPIVTVEHLGNRVFTEQNLPMVSDADKERLNKYVLSEGDIVFSRVGSVDRCSYVDSNHSGWMFSGRCLRVRPYNAIYPLYLYYFFCMESTKQFVRNIAVGATMPSINTKLMGKIEVSVPSIDTQKRIAAILSAIDDKIDLNNAINENLEQQAQALFKAWFVDFEPFGGVMPDDWTETTLGTIAAISTKSINPLKQPDLYLEHYSIPAYDEQHYPVFEYASEVKSNKYILTNNCVMISKLNPDTKRIWRPLCLSANPVCSTEFIVYEAVNPKYKDYIYSLIDSQSFSDYLCAHTTGSTNSRQRATPKTTLDFPCVLPTDDTMSQFCGVVTPIYNQIGANLIENQRLAFLRDTLLPKLMNGEIDVSAVQI